MKQTVVGVFDRYSQASEAARQLRDSGFGDSVYVTEEPASSTAGARTERHTEDRDTGVFAHVRSFFAELFTPDDQREVGSYAEAVRRGGGVVRVEVDSETEADQARDALQAAGAVDLDERVSEWRASGWTGDEGLGSTMDDSVAVGAPAGTQLASANAEAGIASGGTGGTRGATESSSMGTTADSGREATTGRDADVIPVVREDIRVGKRAVTTGGVRVYARTVETPVQESIDLRSERAVVERRPVDRPATGADLDAMDGRTIEVTETTEQPVVQKEARVVEEVSVGKRVDERTEEIRDTVRNTEVNVEPVQGSTSASALGSAGTSGDAMAGSIDTDDDARYRSHFLQNFAGTGGRYEDYEPAYRYGRLVRDDPRYANRDWAEIEPDVRRDWEGRNTGSAWERFKAAVRHGWERMTS